MSFRSLLVGAVATAALAAAAGSVSADSLTISTTTGRQGDGGEFKVTISGYTPWNMSSSVTSVDGGTFNTFCIERNEYVSLGSTYYYTIEDAAKKGGVGGGDGTQDAIGDYTAKLYYTFWTNQWAVTTSGSAAAGLADLTYNYANTGGTRGGDGKALQEAIWFLEGEYTGSSTDAYNALSTAAKAFVDYARDTDLTWAVLGRTWTDSNGDGTGNHIGGVKALNLWTNSNNTGFVQSQLIVVPLPAGALMGFALLGGLGLVSRIRRRRKHSLV